jgi:predicted CoA-binding protein
LDDVVDVRRAFQIAEQAVARSAKVLVAEGIADDDARRIVRRRLTVIMGLCIKKQRQRLEEI